MELKQKYTKEIDFSPYDFSQDFIDSFFNLDLPTAIKIAKYIEKNLGRFPSNTFTSYILGGVVINKKKKPVTFALEILSTHPPDITLSDIQLISMDEYLDLLNMGMYIKSKKSPKKFVRLK